MTSSDAVQKIRRLFNRVKAGHAGTLDPLATGVLPIALGEATKLIPYIMNAEKCYEFTVSWGVQTETDDVEGNIVKTSHFRPTKEQILNILSRYIGFIEQIPPIYSAIKIQGCPAYKQARRGEEVCLQSRTVFIDSLELIDMINVDQARFSVICGKGTYIRSLARDMAESLGTVGHVSFLRRTAVGGFTAQKAIEYDKLLALHSKDEREKMVHPLSSVLDDIPVIVLNDVALSKLRQGQKIKIPQNNPNSQCVVACQNERGLLQAIAKVEDAFLVPVRVLNV